QRTPAAGEAFVAELAKAEGADRTFDRALGSLRDRLGQPVDEAEARRLVEELAHCWGASLCLRHEPVIADAYIRSRIEGDHGQELGSLDGRLNLTELASRAVPQAD
ncbi:MAG: DNA alkylation response protein, partial [Actinomycetota bacterium]